MRIVFPVFRYLLLVTVPHGKKHGLRVIEVPPLLAVIFQYSRLDDGIDRARFLAEAAEDAFRQVDVVARRTARAVVALVGFDVDGERRAHGLAKLARNAALFAVRIAAQR